MIAIPAAAGVTLDIFAGEDPVIDCEYEFSFPCVLIIRTTSAVRWDPVRVLTQKQQRLDFHSWLSEMAMARVMRSHRVARERANRNRVLAISNVPPIKQRRRRRRWWCGRWRN